MILYKGQTVVNLENKSTEYVPKRKLLVFVSSQDTTFKPFCFLDISK